MGLRIVGIISIDSIIVREERKGECLGGAALNLAVGYKVMGGDPTIVSVIGTDFSNEHRDFLTRNFDQSGIKQISGQTCRFELRYHSFGDSPKIVASTGIVQHLTDHALTVPYVCAHVHICCTWPLVSGRVIDHVINAGAKRVTVSFILGSFREQLSQLHSFLGFVDYIFMNRAEFEILKKAMQPSKIPSTIIVTLGSNGSCAIRGGRVIHHEHPVAPTEIQDTTGAGDVYAGSFLASVDKGLDLREAMRQAAITSAASLSRNGVLHLLKAAKSE